MNYDGHSFTGNIYYYYYVLLLLTLIDALAQWEGGPNEMKMIDEQREIQSNHSRHPTAYACIHVSLSL